MAEDGSCEPNIEIYYCHGKVLIWDQSVVSFIRKKHRIVGSNVGCLTTKPRQNAQFGLPLQLTNIEAKYLLEHCNACLLDSSVFPPYVDLEEEAEKSKRKLQEQYEIQTILKQNLKLDEIKNMKGLIKNGKISKQKQRKMISEDKELNKQDGTITETNSEEVFNEKQFKQFAESELKKVERYGQEQTWIKMEHKSKFSSFMQKIDHTKIKLTEEESKLYLIFCDLHNQGYFLTDGVKFGGNFLVYPGDPGLYHSTYILLHIPYEKEISATEFATFGRLASSVKKTLLLASIDKENKVVYSSMSWSGIV
uniref:tRNA-splicing endonuclease subunit Sen34-like n=1 Tax=Ciona intestinalis TaxID=7719 RepID=UPI000180D057|nr:tRNA-splicing endonuclease subunit Sen34-like [Ciona intestinalis]|eukprot:XP_002123488.1 tRNA-splicing endonuclease subunit Sen34-like [Ciona intestinalis]